MLNNTETFSILKPSIIDDAYVAKEINQQWESRLGFNARDAVKSSDTNVDVWLEIAQFGRYETVRLLASQRKAPAEVLERILLNKSFLELETVEICERLTNNQNTPAHMLEQIYDFVCNYATSANPSIAKHPNTPKNVLVKFLPTSNTEFIKYDIAMNAFYNPNTPHMSALKSSLFLGNQTARKAVWDLHYPLFIAEYEKETGVDVSDWPTEWVMELVK